MVFANGVTQISVRKIQLIFGDQSLGHLLVFVLLHMLLKLLLSMELAWAACTLVVFLVSVAFKVNLEVSFFSKGLAADVAFKWLDALVLSNVNLKS